MCNYSDVILRIGERQGEKRGWDNATKAAQAAAQEKDCRRVRNMYAIGTSPEIIASTMELSVEQVKEWIQQGPPAQ